MKLISKGLKQKERLKSAIDSGEQSIRLCKSIFGEDAFDKSLLKKKPRRNDESKIQQSFVKWFSLQYPQYYKLLFAIPNGGKRGKITASIMKSEGQKRGVADIFLSVPKITWYEKYRRHGLYIETKTDIGKQSKEQKEFQKAVEAQGYQYTICRSIDEFINTINDYL